MTPDRRHLASLDVFRGVAVAGMILVNNPGNWTTVFESVTHAGGNGATLADLVFPCFIFILGAAMPFAFGRRLEHGGSRPGLAARIVRRSAWLIALGLLLNLVAAAPAVAAMRIPGVLQRIGLVYLVAAPIVMYTGAGARAAWTGVLLAVHSALLLLPVGAGATGLASPHTIADALDRAVFGRHLLSADGDPEGLLGTMTAVSTALLGSMAGDWLRADRAPTVKFAGLALGGVAALAAGLVCASALPLNKPLWTASFVLFTGGIAALALAACYLLLDVYDYRSWATPFLWLGVNPLAIYCASELLGHLLDAPWPPGAAQPMTLRSSIFWSALRPLVPALPDEWLSLAFALLIVTAWMAVAGVLYRRGVRLHV